MMTSIMNCSGREAQLYTVLCPSALIAVGTASLSLKHGHVEQSSASTKQDRPVILETTEGSQACLPSKTCDVLRQTPNTETGDLHESQAAFWSGCTCTAHMSTFARSPGAAHKHVTLNAVYPDIRAEGV